MDMVQAQALVSQHNKYGKHQDQWEEGVVDDDDMNNNGSTSSSFDNSSSTNGSTSSLSDDDDVDDASSPTSSISSSSSNSTGPLFELSDLKAHLPIKRGLSNFYQGKSQSFTSLSRVTTIEDLPKKETPYRRKLKVSKSYGNGLDSYKPYTLPKAIISKKASRGGGASLSFPGRGGSFFNNNSCRPPLAPTHNKFC